ncbi:cellulase family glycosylhydrolase [Nocardiopsis ansamitocini]|uniref:Endoglucanase n=1 Tax=Nocardiopsis ansamitocini TaxID=1670832 RepID=A0A9W6P383_9ACTN|nr:cellulase family glycosylhydrolase [Nocardiopsis ansamitocini]GLU46267.1 beta-mannosidase [Nocardiopsis ansamitocini]
MRKRLALAATAVLALLASLFVLAQPAHAQTGFTVEEGRLLDANGNDFVMRGVSHAHTWYAQETDSFAGIKSHGANTVRVVLSNGGQWTRNDASDVANVISICKANRLICMLEVHDTTGYGEAGAAVTLDEAVDYWISIQSVLSGEEDYILINIGNEPYGNNASVNAGWASATSGAITRLRDAGFDHTLVVDAPNWGQDWAHIMRDNAPDVYAADPTGNTLFSIHMYGVYAQAATVTAYLEHFVDAGLPLVVGEFGHDHSDGNPDEDTIMAEAERLGLGYIGWSWSGNSGGVDYLDMTEGFDADNLTSWGERIFYGSNGIDATAEEASVFGGSNPGPGPGPSPDPGGNTGCTAVYTTVGQWQGGFQGQVTVTAGAAALAGWQVKWTFGGGQSVSQSWSTSLSTSGAAVTAANASYNGTLAASGSTTFGFLGSGATPSSLALTCTAL